MHLPVRELDWSSFLRRPALESPSKEILDSLLSKPVLITGAGGSIGSALALRLAHLGLPGLAMLESAEKHLRDLQRQWAEVENAAHSAEAQPSFIMGSTLDSGLIKEIFSAHRPGIVFHAAAHKHLPLLEEQLIEAIVNNIFGTEIVVAAARAHRARVILLSTDKAAEPRSILGATKRVAEEIVLASGGTVLRLGNVLGSSGSVAEVFAGQLKRGEPLTITDPAARRYFLTFREAVDLLLFAAAHPASPALLAPSLHSEYSIIELARFIENQIAPDSVSHSQAPHYIFTGLRPGEKLSECFWGRSESAMPAGPGNLIGIQPKRIARAQFEKDLAVLHAAVNEHNAAAALAQLCALVPDFQPSSVALAHAQSSGQGVCA